MVNRLTLVSRTRSFGALYLLFNLEGTGGTAAAVPKSIIFKGDWKRKSPPSRENREQPNMGV